MSDINNYPYSPLYSNSVLARYVKCNKAKMACEGKYREIRHKEIKYKELESGFKIWREREFRELRSARTPLTKSEE